MELPQSVLGLLRWIGAAQARAAEDWARERGLSIEQALTLGWLAENPGAMQKDVARMSRTTAASASSLLQGLERRGLVERRTADGDERSKRVVATAAATDLLVGFEAGMADVEALVLAPLDDDEQLALRALLTKVAAQLPEPTRG